MVGPPKRLAAALTGLGAGLCVLGWYQASGQPTVPQQIPYLASATIPGAALLAAGAVALLRPSAPADAASARARALAPGRRGASRAPDAGAAFLRVPDGRYLHRADCPLMDGRADAVVLSPEQALEHAGPSPCPLCQAEPPADPRAEPNEPPA